MGPKREMVPLLQKSVPVNAAGGHSILLTGNPFLTSRCDLNHRPAVGIVRFSDNSGGGGAWRKPRLQSLSRITTPQPCKTDYWNLSQRAFPIRHQEDQPARRHNASIRTA